MAFVSLNPLRTRCLGTEIFGRILFMLITEAVDAPLLALQSVKPLTQSMTRGYNYPRFL